MNSNDLQAIAELTAEAFNHQRKFNIHFRQCQRGHSHYSNGYISIPKWTLKYGEAYTIYYVIHELSHQIAYDKYLSKGHDSQFKEIEIKALALWNISIKYRTTKMKYYPASISMNGQLEKCPFSGL